MPNPKLGTVTMNVKDAVTAAKSGQVEFRAEKAGIIHAGVGKASFEDDKLVQNIRALVDAVQKAKPDRRQGHLPAEGGPVLDHGPRHPGRCGEPGWLVEIRRAAMARRASGVPCKACGAADTCPRLHVARKVQGASARAQETGMPEMPKVSGGSG